MAKNEPLKKEFLVPSDLTEVPAASARVLDFLAPLGLAEAVLFDLRLCFEEALINAMKYGNRLDPAIDVRVGVEASPAEVTLSVEDQGEGFIPEKLDDCTQESNLTRNRGRGVFLIRKLMDKIEYNSKGNKIVMVKRVQKDPAAKR
jgi:serine/threonine-protein kinase RsbW